tara:strand:- start:156 stop:593 length:438 start_codon:yes stop_codon:yes gene_type:complete
MFKKQAITLVLIVVIIIFLYYLNKINRLQLRENFDEHNANYIDKMDYSNEILVKFCKKLRTLDKPNDFNILLKNMKEKSIHQNREIIDSLIEEIQSLQKEISLQTTESRDKYKLDTHNSASLQVDAVNKAIHNVKNSNNISVNLV